MSTKTIKLTDEQGNLILPESAVANDGIFKFADGTMIITKTITKHFTLRQTPANNIFFDNELITMDESFVGSYVVFGTAVYSTGHTLPIGGRQNTPTKFQCFVYDFYQRDDDYIVTYTAIGRWK